MKFFVYNSERTSTVYHEFQKGYFDEKTYWKDDSIFLSDDLLYTLGIESLFIQTIPGYCSTDDIEVDSQIWKIVKRESERLGGDIQECISEADRWVANTFSEYNVFTIIGV